MISDFFGLILIYEWFDVLNNREIYEGKWKSNVNILVNGQRSDDSLVLYFYYFSMLRNVPKVNHHTSIDEV